MFCERCGRELSKDANFCEVCGAKISNSDNVVYSEENVNNQSPINTNDKIALNRTSIRVKADKAVVTNDEKKRKGMHPALIIIIVIFCIGALVAGVLVTIHFNTDMERDDDDDDQGRVSDDQDDEEDDEEELDPMQWDPSILEKGIGATVVMGVYKDSPIEWYVINKENGYITLLSKQILDGCTMFNRDMDLDKMINVFSSGNVFSDKQKENILRVRLLSLSEAEDLSSTMLATSINQWTLRSVQQKDSMFNGETWWLGTVDPNGGSIYGYNGETCYYGVKRGKICDSLRGGFYQGFRPVIEIAVSGETGDMGSIEDELAMDWSFQNAAIGSVVTFGAYVKDTYVAIDGEERYNSITPLEWYVLENNERDVVLLSKYIIDVGEFYYYFDFGEPYSGIKFFGAQDYLKKNFDFLNIEKANELSESILKTSLFSEADLYFEYSGCWWLKSDSGEIYIMSESGDMVIDNDGSLWDEVHGIRPVLRVNKYI